MRQFYIGRFTPVSRRRRQQAEERGNAQYTDIMFAIRELSGATERYGQECNDAETDTYEELDDLYDDAREIVVEEQKASTSLIQRRLKVGYGRAARIIDQLEAQGVIAPSDGTNKMRVVFVPRVADSGDGNVHG